MSENFDLPDIEFTVDIETRRIVDRQTTLGTVESQHWVHDIYVRDSANRNLLVFSNQGYENRQFAIELAEKLFRGRPAQLRVWGGKEGVTLIEAYRL